MRTTGIGYMACAPCMKMRYRLAKKMGLDNYNRIRGKLFPLSPEDEQQLRGAATGGHAGQAKGADGKG